MTTEKTTGQLDADGDQGLMTTAEYEQLVAEATARGENTFDAPTREQIAELRKRMKQEESGS